MGYKCLVFLCIIVIFGWFSRDNFRRLGLLSDLYKAIISSLIGCVYVFVFGFEFILFNSNWKYISDSLDWGLLDC